MTTTVLQPQVERREDNKKKRAGWRGGGCIKNVTNREGKKIHQEKTESVVEITKSNGICRRASSDFDSPVIAPE